MKFKWVFVKDWNGVANQFRILRLDDKGNGQYSCTFVNSSKDIEKKVVSEQDLFQ